MKRVYVAAPYTAAHPYHVLLNVRSAIDDGELIDRTPGLTAFVPHLFHFWNARHPGDYERWMEKCLEEVRRSDAVLRREIPSPGASREEALARELGLPVFRTVEEVRAWAK